MSKLYKSELEFHDGYVVLCVEATITSEDEIRLTEDGWILTSNGTELNDGTLAFAFCKQI